MLNVNYFIENSIQALITYNYLIVEVIGNMWVYLLLKRFVSINNSYGKLKWKQKKNKERIANTFHLLNKGCWSCPAGVIIVIISCLLIQGEKKRSYFHCFTLPHTLRIWNTISVDGFVAIVGSHWVISLGF